MSLLEAEGFSFEAVHFSYSERRKSPKGNRTDTVGKPKPKNSTDVHNSSNGFEL